MSTYSATCTRTKPILPLVDDYTKMKVCQTTLPIAAQYCSSTSHPEECTSMARMRCLNSHTAPDLYAYVNIITNNIKCPPTFCGSCVKGSCEGLS